MNQRIAFRIVVNAAVAMAALFAIGLSSCDRRPFYPAPQREGTDIVIDAAALPLETPRFYTYRAGGKNVNFFVMRMNDGVQSYFDACVTCYPKKLGYRCENGYVACRACSVNFSIYRLEKGIGGCFPIKLGGRTVNGRYLIPVAALEKMADKF